MQSLIVCLVLLVPCVLPQDILPTDLRTSTKEASAACQYDNRDGSYTMSLAIKFNGEQIQRVQFLGTDTYTGDGDEVPCAINSGSYNGEFVMFESKVFLNGVTTSQNGCGARTYNQTSTSFVWKALTREFYDKGILTGLDKIYTIVCTSDNAYSNVVTTFAHIFEDDKESNANRILPENEILVLERDANNDFSQRAQDGIEVGQDVKLRVRSRIKAPGLRIENIEHYGVYVYSCEYGFHLAGPYTQFIQQNGCPNTVFSELTTGFLHSAGQFEDSSDNRQWFLTTTEQFVLLNQQPPNHLVYITCYVSYCFGVVESDRRCNDYCLYPNGRRRRQATPDDVDKITITVEIKEGENGVTDGGITKETENPDSSQTENEKGSSKTLVIGLVSGIAGLLLILGAILLAIFCCRQWGARSRRSRDDDTSSVASSRQTLPNHITPSQFTSPYKHQQY